MKVFRVVLAVATMLALTSLAPIVHLSGQNRVSGLPLPLHLSAVAQDLDRGLSTPLSITVDRWSTDRVRDDLLNILSTKGESNLLDALQHAPTVGSIRTPTSLA